MFVPLWIFYRVPESLYLYLGILPSLDYAMPHRSLASELGF